MKQPPPGILKPITRERVEEIAKQYGGKEEGVGLEDVFTSEEIERIRKLAERKKSS